jgi:hypothetical protein
VYIINVSMRFLDYIIGTDRSVQDKISIVSNHNSSSSNIEDETHNFKIRKSKLLVVLYNPKKTQLIQEVKGVNRFTLMILPLYSKVR